jgi:hypothetical protein
MFSSPPKPFELPPYASAMADCFAKAESPPPPRVRHFSRGTRNLFLLEAKKGEKSEGMLSKPLVYHFGFGDYNYFLLLFSGLKRVVCWFYF